MNIPKLREAYIDCYGNTERFDAMLARREQKFVDKAVAVANGKLTAEQAREMLHDFDRVDEELDL